LPSFKMSKIDFLDDWELILDNGKVDTILCKLCKEEGKEQRPIRSSSDDKMMSLGEQHRFFRHQRDAIGYPVEADFYNQQCQTCSWYFPVKRILESHEKTCTGPEARWEAVRIATEVRARSKAVDNQNNRSCTPTEAETVEQKPDVAALDAAVAKSKSATPSTQPNSTLRPLLQKHKVKPCKVLLVRNKYVEELLKKRKRPDDGKENAEPLKKIKIENGETPVDVKPFPKENDIALATIHPTSTLDELDDHLDLPTDVLTMGNKWWERTSLPGGFFCPLCKTRPLSQPVYIEDHVSAQHFKQRRFVCLVCREEGAAVSDWPHRTTIEQHLKKMHPKLFKQKGMSLCLRRPLVPGVVNVMRLFFKLYPKPGEEVKDVHLPKRQLGPDDATTRNNSHWNCPDCKQKFMTREARTVIDHIMWRHRNAPRYHCSICNDGVGYGLMANFFDHCKREHACDKPDYLRKLLLKVDRVSEDLLKLYDVTEEEDKAMHEQREVVSDVDEAEVEVKIERADVGNLEADIKTEPREEMELKIE